MKERIEYLDSLRGIAAMTVVIFHCMISFVIFHSANYKNEYANGFIKFITESPFKMFWNGTEAVLLFFVLSGFVLSISFLKGKPHSYDVFLMRRFTRIGIPYFTVMLVSVILSMLFLNFSHIEGMSETFSRRWDHPVTFKSIIAYIFMLNYDTANVNGVVWTLYHEMRISFVFPIMMFIIIKLNFIKSIVVNAVIISITWLGLLVISTKSNGAIEFLSNDFRATAFYACFFVLGATLSKYRKEVSNYLSPKKPIVKFSLLLLSVLLISARWVRDVSPILPNQMHELTVGVGIILVFAVALSSSLTQKVLMNRSLLWLGKISFSLYLIHILVLMLLAITFGKYAIWLTPIISLPVAALTYKYVEEPAIHVGRKWTSYLKEKKMIKAKAS